MKLAENFCAVAVNSFNHAGKGFDVPIGRHGQLARQTRAVTLIDAGNAGHQQSEAVFRAFFIIGDELFRGGPVKISHPHFQGRQNHAVAQNHAADSAF